MDRYLHLNCLDPCRVAFCLPSSSFQQVLEPARGHIHWSCCRPGRLSVTCGMVDRFLDRGTISGLRSCSWSRHWLSLLELLALSKESHGLWERGGSLTTRWIGPGILQIKQEIVAMEARGIPSEEAVPGAPWPSLAATPRQPYGRTLRAQAGRQLAAVMRRDEILGRAMRGKA